MKSLPDNDSPRVELKLKESKEESTYTKNSKENILKYCPHIETVVINALLSCLEDTNILAVKNALDFLYKYLPLKSEIIG